MKEWFNDVSKLLFPKLCFLCKQDLIVGENHICNLCIAEMPATNFHNHEVNALNEKLKGRIDFEEVMAVYYFNADGKIQELLHEIKYKNNRHLAISLGALIGHKIGHALKGIDLIIPVPLHNKRKNERGYNQSALLAQGLGNVLSLTVECNVVKRIKNTESQTHKTRSEREDNMQNAFEWNLDIKDKHILLLDDVITTGATLESLVQAMPKDLGNRISILAFATAVAL